MSRRKTHEEFLTDCKQRGIDQVIIKGQYQGGAKKILVQCLKCQNEWYISPGHLLNGRGCPKCSGHHKRTQEEFVSEIAEKLPTLEIIGTFVDRKTRIEVRCKVCNHSWAPKATSLLCGHGCPKCSHSYRRNTEEFKKEMADISPDLEILGEYKSRKDGILTRCRICGYEWEPAPNNLLHGATCLRCSYEKRGAQSRITHEEFVLKLHAVNPRVEVIGFYSRMDEKVWCRCLVCGYEWNVAPGSLLQGHGCPECKRSGTSYMEQVVLYALQSALGETSVKHRSKSEIGRELDIYIPSLRLAIEIGSWFWHKNKAASDDERRELCKSAGIQLLTVFDSYDGDGCLGADLIWCYCENLGQPSSEAVLKGLVGRIFAFVGLSVSLDDVLWDKIKFKARLSTRRISQEEFEARVAEIRPDIMILGEYQGGHEPIECQCRTCGYVWKSEPSRLLMGRGCRKCGRVTVGDKYRKSHEQFVSELMEKNSTITVLGRYHSLREKLEVCCNVCGHIWSVAPSSILHNGRGCPACWESRRGKSLLKSEEEFLEGFAQNGNPEVLILGNYDKDNVPIQVKCKKCGLEWKARPSGLLRGHGCNRCAGHQQKTNEQFIQELKQAQPTVIPLEPYQKADKKIKVCCGVCAYEWMARPTTLIKGNL